VIIGMHHDQDIRNMGGLRKYMPITWLTSLLGSLALIGTPFFSGFYSKDSIIEAVKVAQVPGAGFAYFAVVAGVFVTAFYSFRMYFLVFHGKERWMQAGMGMQPRRAGQAARTTRMPSMTTMARTTTTALMRASRPGPQRQAARVAPGGYAAPGAAGDSVGADRPVHDRTDAVRRLLQGRDHGRCAPRGDGRPGQAFPWLGGDGHARADHAAVLAGGGGVAFAYYCYMINPALPTAIKNATGGINRCSRTSTTWTASTKCSSRAVRAAGFGFLEDRRPDADRWPDRQRLGQAHRLDRVTREARAVRLHLSLCDRNDCRVAVLLWWFVPLVKH
jgi:hypothetical protein